MNQPQSQTQMQQIQFQSFVPTMNDYGPFLIIVAILLYGIREIFLAASDVKADSDAMAYYTIIIILAVIIAFMYIIHKTIGQQFFFPLLIFSLITGFFFVALYGMIYAGLAKYIFNKYLLYVLVVAIILVGLSIVYNIFSGNLKRMKKNWWGFTINFIMYIPCLISDAVSYFVRDYQSTPLSALLLFILEIFLLLVYFYLYPLASKHFTGDYTVLLKEPVMLSTKTSLGESFFQNFKNRQVSPPKITALGITGTDLEYSPYATNYSISMWTYLNSMPVSKISYSPGTSTRIFNYSGMRPSLLHEIDSDGRPKYTAYFSENVKHSFEMPYQKWNYLVFNYKGASVDLFVNGVLEYSHNFGSDVSQLYGPPDEINVGGETDEIDGVYGSICNITYYPRQLTGPEIITTYNLKSIHNPPV